MIELKRICIGYIYTNKMGLTTQQAKINTILLVITALLAATTVNTTISFAKPPSLPWQLCGNGMKEGREQCDDGNSEDTDGCSSACLTQEGYNCQTQHSSKSLCFAGISAAKRLLADENGTSVQACGNTILETGEECDDGNLNDGDGCSSTCRIQIGFRCLLVFATSQCRSICGDGLVVGNEQCDDGNVKSGDGCSSSCRVEAGYSCAYSSVSRKSICCINGTEYSATIDSCVNTTSGSNTTNTTDLNNTAGSNSTNTTNSTANPSDTTNNSTSDNSTNTVDNHTSANASTNGTSNSSAADTTNSTNPSNATLHNQTSPDNTTNTTSQSNTSASNGSNQTTPANTTIDNTTNTTSNNETNTTNNITSLSSSPFVVTLFIKIPSQNALLVQLSTSARLLAQASLLTHANFPYQHYQIQQAPTGKLVLQFNYNVSLNGYSQLYFAINNQTVSLPAVTANNLALKCYSPQYYSIYNTFSILMPIFAYAVLCLLILTFLFSSKLIAVQTLLIFQFTFGGLLMMRKIESIMYPFKELWIFDGFNVRSHYQSNVPPRIGALDMTSDFIQNFNINIAIYLLPLVVGAVLSIQKLRLTKHRAVVLGEWQLSALLVCIQQLVFAFVINIQYSQAPAFGVIFGLMLMLLYLFYINRLYDRKKQVHLTTKSQFGDFKQFFQVNFLNFYVLSMVYRLSLSLVLVLMSDSIISQSLALVLTVSWAAIIIIKRPYKKSSKLIPIVNSLIMVLISIFYLYQRNKADSPQINFATFMPITLICILGLTCIFNTLYAGLHFRSLHRRRQEMERRMKEHTSNDKSSLADTSHEHIQNRMSLVISDLNNNSQIFCKEFIDPGHNHQSTDFKIISQVKTRQFGPHMLEISQEYERQIGVYTLQDLQQEPKQDSSGIQANIE